MGRIILDCDLMRYRDSGLYHYCLNLGHYVQQELVSRGPHRMAFYVPEAEKNTFGSQQECIPERKWHRGMFRPFLWNCRLWHAPFQSGRVLPRPGKGTKILLTVHDLNVLHEDKTAKERRLSLQHTQKLVDKADALVCISHHCKKDVMEFMDTGGKPVYVIHNGTHQVNIPPAQPVGYRPERPFMFGMGYVNRKKNFHTLIPLLETPEIELIIAGRLDEPDYIDAMHQEAERLGVGERLKILGPVPEADKAWYFQHCTAFMMPSLAEGFGAPVVEAMAFGKPLFLSNLTSLPEIGADVAFYFQSFEPDHMLDVFSSGMQDYSKNGLANRIRARGQRFSWKEKAVEYADVYEALLNQ
jgi:glycosyltransferase involved in cell wall biosynthesis